jgi:hypothetical protein
MSFHSIRITPAILATISDNLGLDATRLANIQRVESVVPITLCERSRKNKASLTRSNYRVDTILKFRGFSGQELELHSVLMQARRYKY